MIWEAGIGGGDAYVVAGRPNASPQSGSRRFAAGRL